MFGILFSIIHISLNLVMLLVFVRSLNALAEQTQILDAQRVGELQTLALKTIVYIAGNILLFTFLWFCFIVYPLNLRQAEVGWIESGARVWLYIHSRRMHAPSRLALNTIHHNTHRPPSCTTSRCCSSSTSASTCEAS